MGVGAAALATVISQFTSAILCMIHLLRTKEEYRLHIRKIRFDGRALARLSATVCRPVSRTRLFRSQTFFVQTNINAFGENGRNGQAAVHMAKIEGLHSFRLHAFTMVINDVLSARISVQNSMTGRKKGARLAFSVPLPSPS